MSPTPTLELDVRDLEERIVEADRLIVDKEAALDARTDELGAQGVTSATISAEIAKELVEARKEIDGLKDERIILGDLRSSELQKLSAKRGAPGNREADKGGYGRFQRVMGGFHSLLFDSPEFVAAGITPDRFAGNAMVGPTPAVEAVSKDALMFRLEAGLPIFAAAAPADLDAGIPLDERLFPTVETLRRQIRLIDLVTVGSTESDTVVYTRQTVRTANAAETDLGTAYSESLFDFEQVEAFVRDIGHYTTMHRSNIADAGQFDTLVRRQLAEDVMLRLESQMYAGNGAGVNLAGITDDAYTIQEVDRDTTNETRIDATHRGITKVRLAFREPDAIVVHPNDYQDILFEKDENERHLLVPAGFTSAAVRPVQTLWGLPLIPTPVATEGTGLLGYWPDATLWIRSGVALSASDSHEDYFTKRQVAVLAEMRAAFSVQRPDAFCALNFF